MTLTYDVRMSAAEIIPPAVDQQWLAAQLVVVGCVLAVDDRLQIEGEMYHDHLHAATVRVDGVEKGDAVAAGDTLVAWSWSKALRPPRAYGHQGGPVPRADTCVRLYLSQDAAGRWQIGTVTGLELVEAQPDAHGVMHVAIGAMGIEPWVRDQYLRGAGQHRGAANIRLPEGHVAPVLPPPVLVPVTMLPRPGGAPGR